MREKRETSNTKVMDDEVLQRVFQEGGRDYIHQPSTSTSSSILQSLPLHVVRLFLFGFWIILFLFFCLILIISLNADHFCNCLN